MGISRTSPHPELRAVTRPPSANVNMMETEFVAAQHGCTEPVMVLNEEIPHPVMMEKSPEHMQRQEV